ncbi:hypothetical protein TrST_g1704 [Triparma strigata]|uniref:FG-GAP repeat-containing protein n=1 Tax=Triparma strigata TaxID=1606541 RepID=A0A9W6ZF24_9STRA|nr:hypothetical protein TrST_g1704 [Triparma strigata]
MRQKPTVSIRWRDLICVALALVALNPPSLFPSTSTSSPQSPSSLAFTFHKAFYLRNAEVDHAYDSSTPTYVPRTAESPGYVIARRGGSLESYVSMYDIRADYSSDQMIYLSEEASDRQLGVIKGTTEGYYAVAGTDYVVEIDPLGVVSFCNVGGSTDFLSAFSNLRSRPVLLSPAFQFDLKEMDVDGFWDHQTKESSRGCVPRFAFSDFGVQFLPRLEGIKQEDLLGAASEWERRNENVFLVAATVDAELCGKEEESDDESSESPAPEPTERKKFHILTAIAESGRILYASTSKPLHLIDLNDDRTRILPASSVWSLPEKYKSSLAESLPNPAPPLALGHFEKEDIIAKKREMRNKKRKRKAGSLPATSKHPNVAILHLDSGLAVFAMKTGRRLTHLPLPVPPPSSNPSFVYSDLNSDGTPELITIDSKGLLDVKTAHNPPTALFNVSIAQSSAGSKTQKNAQPDDSYIYVENASIFTATLHGIVSRVEKRKKSWVSARGAAWHKENDQNPKIKRITEFDKSFIMVTGETDVVLISKHNGKEVGRLRLPQTITETPVVVDFDEDGQADIIVTTPDAVWGYRIKLNSKWNPINIVVGGLLLLMCIIVWAVESGIFSDDIYESKDKQTSAAVVRSTDLDTYELKMIKRATATAANAEAKQKINQYRKINR